MTEGINKVWSHPFLWIVTITVIAFNTAAALSHSARLAYIALAGTGVAALVAIGIGVSAGLMKLKVRRQP